MLHKSNNTTHFVQPHAILYLFDKLHFNHRQSDDVVDLEYTSLDAFLLGLLDKRYVHGICNVDLLVLAHLGKCLVQPTPNHILERSNGFKSRLLVGDVRLAAGKFTIDTLDRTRKVFIVKVSKLLGCPLQGLLDVAVLKELECDVSASRGKH